MHWWTIGLVANAVIGLGYFAIFTSIVVPLVRSGQLVKNPLGAATAAIFLTCAVHHSVHSVHMLMPAFDVDLERGTAMRDAWSWQLAMWDVISAGVAVWYWSLRRTYSSLMQGAQLFEDMRKREQQALELNDNVLQGLVVAKLALDLDDRDKAVEALTASIASASHIITDLIGPEGRPMSAGLLRSSAAVVATAPSVPPLTTAAHVAVAPQSDGSPPGASA